MKIIFLFALLIVFAGCGQSDNSGKKESRENNGSKTSPANQDNFTGKKIFGIKSAKIIFNYSDGNETGTETLYFDDYGAMATLVVNKKSKYSTVNQTIIWKDNGSTIIDHEKKTVATSGFRSKATEPPAIADIDEQSRKNIGYEKLADETIAGKTCEVWFNSKQNFKYCLWNKIALKEELGSSIIREATLVEEVSEIPASVMEIPKDYKQ